MAKPVKIVNKLNTPSQLDIPAYVMNFPFSLSADNPNNVWMEEADDEDMVLDHDKAYAQFMDLYNYVAAASLVYVLPSLGDFQDQVYVANLGIWLPHLKKENVLIVANYKSEPRKGEDKVGKLFFKMMGYDVYQPETTWEGEADLKWIRDDIFIGGYGIRSDPKSYAWMQDKFDMKILPLLMEDDYLYHLDCLVFPITKEKVIVCTELCDPKQVKQIEKYAEVIDVPADYAYNGITNAVRMHNSIMVASSIDEYPKNHKQFKEESDKIEWMSKVCSDNAMEPVFFNLSEFEKSGAMLSCMMMHLNRMSVQDELV